MLTKAEAIERVEHLINEPDLNFPTRHKQVVYDEFTTEEPDGWLFYYTASEVFWVAGRDPEASENPPVRVDKHTGEIQL